MTRDVDHVMPSRRVQALLAIALVLLVARLAFAPAAPALQVAEAIVRPSQPSDNVAPPLPAKGREFAEIETDRPGNAFSVRSAEPPVSVAPPPVAVQAAPRSAPLAVAPLAQVVALPTAPSVPPPFPLQVIGTWNDGGLPAVFVATPNGAVIARQGTTLLSDYRVTAIGDSEVSLLQASTQRAVSLPIPSVISR